MRVREPARLHVPETEPTSGGNGSITPSQFSSTLLPMISRAPGRIDRVGVVAVLGPRRAVAVAVAVDRVDAVAVLVDPVVGDVDGARVDGRVRVVAIGRPADAVAVRVALDLLAGDASVGVVGDRGVVPVAAVDLLGAAVTGDDVVVAGPAVEDVQAAAAEERRRCPGRR